jgi:multiple sugar transport system substrate-binding protein
VHYSDFEKQDNALTARVVASIAGCKGGIMTTQQATHPSLQALLARRISRRDLLRRTAAFGVAVPGLSALLAACAGGGGERAQRPLTPTFYQWIIDLHPAIEDTVNPQFEKEAPLNFQIAPVQGFGIERFVAEAKKKTSTWDVYVGMTPFIEMEPLSEAGVIVPWDDYASQDVLNEMIPSIREEGQLEGKQYNWPFLLDVIIQGWNSDLVEKAGLDPTQAPKTWDEYLANCKKVVDSGAAPFGCTFDAHGWRSLAPITHSVSTDVYTEEGLFDFTNDAVVSALEIMKQMFELANPNTLDPGQTDAGVNDTPDEGVFGKRQAAYYVKYQNAHLRMAGVWPNPDELRLGRLPAFPGGEGATVFWTTGATLFRYGKEKDTAADYLDMLTHSETVWKESIGGEAGSVAPGQLPPYASLWNEWKSNPPPWMEDWAFFVVDQLKISRPIQTSKFGVTQFLIGQPHWETYIKGEESDPKKALAKAMNAVVEEVKKGG